MKKIISLSIIIGLLFCLTACGGKKSDKNETEKVTSSTASSFTELSQSDIEELLQKYMQNFGATSYYQDVSVKQRCLLVTPNSLVLIFLVPNSVKTTEIFDDSIVRIEKNELGDFVTLKIFDKTGTNIDIMLSPADAQAVSTLTFSQREAATSSEATAPTSSQAVKSSSSKAKTKTKTTSKAKSTVSNSAPATVSTPATTTSLSTTTSTEETPE